MENYLNKIEAWCWRYRENKRNYPGLHFTAKPAACDAIHRCLQTLRQSNDDSFRTMPLQRLVPQDEAKVSGGQKYESFVRLRIAIHTESDHIRQMSFRSDGDMVCFDFVENHLADFEQGLINVRNGRGDYSIAVRKDLQAGYLMGALDQSSERLWFWPCFGHLGVVE